MKPLRIVATLLALAGASANAANTFFATGDLILFFQKPGDSDTVYVAMGSAPLNYRGSFAGTSGDAGITRSNIVNLNTTLTSAFGAGWASDPDLYMGAVAARSSSGSAVVNGDHNRTVYGSRSRNAVGTVGIAESAPWDFTLSGANTTGANNIVTLGNNLNNTTTQVSQTVPTATSIIDDQNPFVSVPLGIQGTAFNAFAGGVQQRGSAGVFGSLGGINNIEFAIDLYRIPEFADGETVGIEVSGTKRIGSFEGTLVLGNDGNVSFLVPEPSAVALVGIAGLGLVLRRRRN
jgi:hypothetical protein